MKSSTVFDTFLEGLFLGIAFLILHLYFADRKSRSPWSTREGLLFGTAVGMAIGGFWALVTV
jgi:ABC-type uncharacterized transport system permease subunit